MWHWNCTAVHQAQRNTQKKKARRMTSNATIDLPPHEVVGVPVDLWLTARSAFLVTFGVLSVVLGVRFVAFLAQNGAKSRNGRILGGVWISSSLQFGFWYSYAGARMPDWSATEADEKLFVQVMTYSAALFLNYHIAHFYLQALQQYCMNRRLGERAPIIGEEENHHYILQAITRFSVVLSITSMLLVSLLKYYGWSQEMSVWGFGSFFRLLTAFGLLDTVAIFFQNELLAGDAFARLKRAKMNGRTSTADLRKIAALFVFIRVNAIVVSIFSVIMIAIDLDQHQTFLRYSHIYFGTVHASFAFIMAVVASSTSSKRMQHVSPLQSPGLDNIPATSNIRDQSTIEDDSTCHSNTE